MSASLSSGPIYRNAALGHATKQRSELAALDHQRLLVRLAAQPPAETALRASNQKGLRVAGVAHNAVAPESTRLWRLPATEDTCRDFAMTAAELPCTSIAVTGGPKTTPISNNPSGMKQAARTCRLRLGGWDGGMSEAVAEGFDSGLLRDKTEQHMLQQLTGQCHSQGGLLAP